MESERISPNILFQSFLIVAGGYVFSIILLGTLAATFGYFFFPEAMEIWMTPNITKEQVFASPELLLPENLFWVLLISHSLMSVAIGWLITWLSPFAKFHHAIFVSVVVFVGFLQAAVGAPREIQWMFLMMMVAFPVSTLIGAKVFGARSVIA